jgi:hypothetical protein
MRIGIEQIEQNVPGGLTEQIGIVPERRVAPTPSTIDFNGARNARIANLGKIPARKKLSLRGGRRFLRDLLQLGMDIAQGPAEILEAPTR